MQNVKKNNEELDKEKNRYALLRRILGKRGRITIPYELRRQIGFKYNDVLSFSVSESKDAIIIKREKLCDNCSSVKLTSDTETDEMTLLDFLNGLSPEQMKAALVHLSVKWAEMQSQDSNIKKTEGGM